MKSSITTAPLVSVILPFYNDERFLAEAIDSVLAQTLSDWELLLSDDGSTDSSRQIAQHYVASDLARMSLLQHADNKNHRLPATRNMALRASRGEFVALIDADDVWLPFKLEQQCALLRAAPKAGMVFGRSEYWYSWTGDPGDSARDSVPQLAASGIYEPPELMRTTYPLGIFGAPCPSDLMFRRSALRQVGGFAEEFDPWEDIALLAKIFLNVPVVVSEERWDRYRRHPDSAWARAQMSDDEERARAFYFRWLRDYMQQNNVTDPKIWRLYREQTWRYRHATLARCVKRARHIARPLKRMFR